MSNSHRTVLVVNDAGDRNGQDVYQFQQDPDCIYRVLEEKCGMAAISLCQNQSIDGILLELEPPYTPCFEFLQQLQERLGDRCPPILAISCETLELAVQAFKNGVADYLVKDRVTAQELVAALETAIAKTRLKRDLQRIQEQSQGASQQWVDRSVAVDIAQQRIAQQRVEAELRVSQQRYQELAEAMPQIVWAADATGAVNYWNRSWYEYTGFSEAESMGLAGINAVHPDDRDRTLVQWSQSIARSVPFSTEYRIRHRDGGYRWFICRATPTHDPRGQLTGWIGAIVDIDDQKQLEERLRLVTRAVNGLVFDWNLETNEVYRSENLFDLVGVRPEDAPASADWWRDRVHPDDMARLQPQFTELFNNTAAELYESEYRVRHVAGHWVDVWERSYLIRDKQGQIVRMVGSTVDVSDRKQAERNLAETHIQLEAALAAGSIYTWRWNIADNLVSPNRGLARLFGIDPVVAAAGLPIERFLAAIHLDDRPQIIAAIEQAIATGEDYSEEFRVYDADGTEHWVIARGRVEYDANGRAIGFPGALTDISDRKQTEAVLLESESRFRQMTDAAPMLVWMSGTDKGCTYFNQSWLNFTGRTVEQEMGNGWAEGVHPDDFDRCLRIYSNSFDARLPFEMDYRLRRFDGEYRWIYDAGAPRFAANGEFLGYIGSCFDIHDRRMAETALQESESRFRTLADNISQFAWMANEIGWIFWYNQRWFDYTGTTLEEMQGWGWTKVHHPDHVDRVVEKFDRDINAGEVWEDTFPLRGKDGEYRWFLSRAVPVRDEQGRVLRWFGTNTDITDRKQAETTLAQQRTLLETILQQSAHAIIVCDAKGNLSFVNGEARRLAQLDPNSTTLEIALEAWGTAYDLEGNFIPLEEYSLARALRGETTNTLEVHMVWQNGNAYDILISAAPLWNEDQQIIGAVASFVDISDRKQVEAALQQSEDRLRIAITSAKLGTWDWNLLTNELIWDEKCKAMFGLPPEAELTIETFFKGLHPDDRDRLEQVVQDCLDPANGGNYDIEYRTIGIENGVERWVAAKGQVYFDRTGMPLRFIGTAIDITERKQAEQALAERAEELTQLNQILKTMTANLEQRNQDLNQFAHVVSHDLKAPLRGIRNLAQWIQDDLGDRLPPENQEQLRLLGSRVNRMEALIHDLLDYCRAGRTRQQPETIDVDALIKELLDTIAVPTNVLIRIPTPLPTFQARRLMLSQVFANLLTNAIKYGCGEDPCEVTIAVRESADEYEFAIADEGPGIDSKHHEKIFGIFETLQSKDSTNSTGIGLAIAKRLIESEGGKIWIKSILGEGATFYFTLPKRPL